MVRRRFYGIRCFSRNPRANDFIKEGTRVTKSAHFRVRPTTKQATGTSVCCWFVRTGRIASNSVEEAGTKSPSFLPSVE